MPTTRRRFLRCLAIAPAAMLPVFAQAQLRTIPPGAKRAEIRHLQDMIVALDGKPVKLAPGAIIRGPTNLIVLPTALPQDVLVRYTVDNAGLVSRIWILTPQEAAQRDADR